MFKLFLNIIIISSVFSSAKGFCATDIQLLGRWLDSENKKGYEFIEGFGPNVGIALIIKDSKVKDIEKWNFNPAKNSIKIGPWNNYSILVEGATLTLEGKKFQRTKTQSNQDPLISLKKDEIPFIDTLIKYSWRKAAYSSVVSSFISGFTNSSGLYSTKKKDGESLSSWSVANGVLKIADEIYPNAKITENYLILLTSSDSYRVFSKGEERKELKRSDLSKEKSEFIKKLTRGTWSPGSVYSSNLYEYRPTFGDLSGTVFVYKRDKNKYLSARTWEYSLDTGILKEGHTQYMNAKIIGNYLLLLNKNGDTEEYVRVKEFSQEAQTHSMVKKFIVSEKESEDLKILLSRTWRRGSSKYIFTFKPGSNEGFMHEFKSTPMSIRGNTLSTDSKYKKIRQWENKIIFDENDFSLQMQSSPVFMKPISEDEAIKMSKDQKEGNEKLLKTNAKLAVTLNNGKTFSLNLPVKDFSEISLIQLRTN